MYSVNSLKEYKLPWHNNFLKPAADSPSAIELSVQVLYMMMVAASFSKELIKCL